MNRPRSRVEALEALDVVPTYRRTERISIAVALVTSHDTG